MSNSLHSPAYYTGTERGPMQFEYGVDEAQTFVPGDLVFIDTAEGLVVVCGADPALILGWAMGHAVPQQTFPGDTTTPPSLFGEVTAGTDLGKVGVEVIDPGVEYILGVAGTLVATDEGKAYGIVKTNPGFWDVDLSDTSNPRVRIVKADVAGQMATVHFLAAPLQVSAIAS